MKKKSLPAVLLGLTLLIAPGLSAAAAKLPVPGQVTMIDLGATTCIPCKMMAPILEKLTAEYQGKAAIVFVDVWLEPDMGKKFKVFMIPTQIFFNAEGQEVSRHVGFMAENDIVEQLAKLGVTRPADGK